MGSLQIHPRPVDPEGDVSTGPPWLLQVDLSLQRFGQIDDEELRECRSQGNSGYRVQVPFRPRPHDLDASGRPHFLAGLRHLETNTAKSQAQYAKA